MNVEIINKKFRLDIYGFSQEVINNDYVGTAFKLMDRMWQIVKTNGLKNKGMNIWVYEAGEKIFAGVELNETPDNTTGLEQKRIDLNKYAYHKHIGPYNLIKQAGLNMRDEIIKRGCTTILLRSYSFQAPSFYEKNGYKTVYVLDDFPIGYRHFTLVKKLFPENLT